MKLLGWSLAAGPYLLGLARPAERLVCKKNLLVFVTG
jgi:hypothetical protein